MKKIFLSFSAVFFALFFAACKANIPDNYNRESERVFRLGVNGNTSFENIEGGEFYTRYGHGEINFVINAERETFAVFSVPADSAVKTYFVFEIEQANESSPNFLLCTYRENLQGVEFSVLRRTAEGREFVPTPTLIDGKTGKHTIRISGDFRGKEFRQDNFVVIGTDSLYAGADLDEIKKYIDSKSNSIKNLTKENAAYIIAYPWRTIRVGFYEEVAVIEAPTGTAKQIITPDKGLLSRVNEIFAQAICKIEAVDENYDVKIVFQGGVPGGNNRARVIFYDERDSIYDAFVSDSLKYASVFKISDGFFYPRDVAYAIAFLSGASYIADDRESVKTVFQNLMYPFGTGLHLSFRQWNQLHARRER